MRKCFGHLDAIGMCNSSCARGNVPHRYFAASMHSIADERRP